MGEEEEDEEKEEDERRFSFLGSHVLVRKQTVT